MNTRVKSHDKILLQNTKTGEYFMTTACFDWDGGRYLPCCVGTIDIINGKHMLQPFALVGLIVPIRLHEESINV